MGRQLRIEYPGAWYHVMNRGAARQTIFHDPSYYKLFLDNLFKVCEEFQVEIHAYCLMGNHYHLLVRTTKPNLNKAMKKINGVFAQKHNHFQEKDGPLFKGRYKAFLIDEYDYLLEVNRYIHLNPVLAYIVNKPEEYLWSSYKYYVSERPKPKWFFCNKVMEYFNNEIDRYKKFVLDSVAVKKKLLAKKRRPIPVVGGEKFTKNICNQFNLSLSTKDIRKQCGPVYSMQDIIKAVSMHFNIVPLKVISRSTAKKPPLNLPKNIAIYLACQFSGKSQKSIAEKFDNISQTRVVLVCKQVASLLTRDAHLSKTLAQIETILATG